MSAHAPSTRHPVASISLELCGRLAELAGRTLSVDIPAEGCRADELLARVAEQAPLIAALVSEGRIRVCIGEAIVDGAALVRPGDQVALFPPVSGG